MHDLITYYEDKKYGPFIRCGTKWGVKQRFLENILKKRKFGPNKTAFFSIEKNDYVVYYAKGSGLVTGIFQVESSKPLYAKDLKGDFYFARRIRKIRGRGNEYLNFKKILEDSKFKNFNFDEILKKDEDFTILENEDYGLIEEAYQNSKYIIKIQNRINSYGLLGWKIDPDVSTGLLEYYNGRATSFSSLFVASVFGLLTLATIMQSVFSEFDLFKDHLILLPTTFLFVFFIIAGYHTLDTYFHYTGLADCVKVRSLDYPFRDDLSKIWGLETDNGKVLEVDLNETIFRREKRHSERWTKRLLKHSIIFKMGYFIAIVALTILIYLNVFSQILLAIKPSA